MSNNPFQERTTTVPLLVVNRLRMIDDGKWSRIADKVEFSWNTLDCEQYLEGLITTGRFDREGFPESVVQVLTVLYAMHPERQTTIDIWSHTTK
jgi:hypothetical protein